jgi:chemotaxis response regulator CheB
VVFGMPKAAIDAGAAVEVAPLNDIPARIARALQRAAQSDPHGGR